jgi:hypothetical protein
MAARKEMSNSDGEKNASPQKETDHKESRTYCRIEGKT